MHTSTHAQVHAQANSCAHAYKHWRDLGRLTLASSLGSSALGGNKERRLRAMSELVGHPGSVANLDSTDFARANLDFSAFTFPWMMSRALLAMLNALQE